MSAHANPRASVWILVLAIGLNALVLWLLRPIADSQLFNAGHDFKLLYAAAQALRDHQNPYDGTILARNAHEAGLPWFALLDANGQLSQPYVYPPVFAWLVIPFTFLGADRALLVWRLLSAAMVAAGTYGLTALWSGATGILGTRVGRLLLSVLVAVSPLTLYGLYWGNPVTVVYAAMGGWVWALSRGRKEWDLAAGALMSVGLLKPQLALPLAVLAALCLLRGGDAGHRRRYVAYGFASACVFWLALDLLATGPAMLLDWPRNILYLSRLTSLQPDMPSLIGLFHPVLVLVSPGKYTAISLTVVALSLLAVGVLYWKLRRVTAAPALLALLTVVWCVGAPYAHANDEILLLPGGLALLVALPGTARIYARWNATQPGTRDRIRWTIALMGMLLAVPALGLLYIGGVLPFLFVTGTQQPSSLAVGLVPLALLAAVALAEPIFMRQAEDAGERPQPVPPESELPAMNPSGTAR